MIKNIRACLNIVFRYAKGQAAVFLAGIIIVAALPPFALYATEQLVNAVLAAMDGTGRAAGYEETARWCVLLVAALCVSAAMAFFNKTREIKIKQILYDDFSKTMLDKLTRIDYRFFEQTDTYDVIQRMGNAPQEKLLKVFVTIVALVSGFISATGYTLIFIRLSVLFVVAGHLVLLLMMYLNYRAIMMMNSLYEEQTPNERMLEYYGKILGDKKSLFELKTCNGIGYILNKRRAMADVLVKDRRKRTVSSQLIWGSGSVAIVLWLALVVGFLIYHIARGTVTVGLFVSILASVTSILGCFTGLSENMAELAKTGIQIKYYKQFTGFREVDTSADAPAVSVPFPPRISFEDVSFAYPGMDTNTLEGVSFELAPGTKLALVGENGAGKSTIVKLLCGLYRPDRGRITINGTDLRRIGGEEQQRLFSVVFQDYVNYQFTVRENVAMGDSARVHNDEEIKAALARGLSGELTDKLDMPLGKLDLNGTDLSGGQWQRLALARACLRESGLLILDEPTASMDPIAENALYTSFVSIMENRGCILVSHRLAVAKLMDRIIVLDGGRIIEQGRHDELMSGGGLYARMFTSQSQWYHDETEA
jgi:ABC-type multidrug transport system fused ATPase/permease subunit